MKVLVLCEYSGIVRDAFIRAGHDAVSVDILPSESDLGPHHQMDALKFLEENQDDFDLGIFHPPCTYLACSGIHWNKGSMERQKKTELALEFVQALMNTTIKRWALENPKSIISSRIRKADQQVQPYHFGEPIQKTTCFWLHNLPKLRPTKDLEKEVKAMHPRDRWPAGWLGPSVEDRGKKRSKFFEGMAAAMATQWGALEHQTSLEDWL